MKTREARNHAQSLVERLRVVVGNRRGKIPVQWADLPPDAQDFMTRWNDLVWGALPLGWRWGEFTDGGFTLTIPEA